MAIKGNPFATPRKAPSRMSAREAERVYLGGAEPPADIAGNEVELTSRETGHKPDTEVRTNWTQTEDKPDTNRTQKRAQTGHKPDTSDARSLSISTKLDTKPDTVSDTKRAQTRHKPDTKTHFGELIGLQRRLVVFVYRSCQKARAKISEPLTIEHVASSLQIQAGSVKTSFRRLEEKKFLRRHSFKNGRGGWARFELSGDVFNALLHLETEHKLDTNWTQSAHKPDTEPDTEPDTSPPSSSSSDLKQNSNTTTTGAENLGSEWLAVDCSPLTEVGAKFGQSQIAQIAKAGGVTPDELQDSIRMFAFDLLHNQKRQSIKGDPLNFFIGILRNGPYLPPQNYRSPQEIQKRAYVEWKRRQEENLKSLDWEIIDAEFQIWWNALSDDERNEHSPRKVGAEGTGAGTPFHLNCVKEQIFLKTVWPTLQNKVPTFDGRQGAEKGAAS